jgi:uncharacterized protein
MDEVTQKINRVVSCYVKEVQKHIKVDKAILYGSYAKGSYNEYSDVDVAIFSEGFEGKNLIEINSFLFSIARRYKEICIEPIGFQNSDLHSDNPFIKEIINTGKEIYVQ